MHNVLLVTGGQIPAHDYPGAARVLADVIERDGLGVKTTIAPPAEIDLADTHALVVFTDGEFFTTDAIARIDAYVRRGHGLVTLHTAAGTNPGSEVWGKLVGSRIKGGVVAKHAAHVADDNHPIGRDVKDFEIDDEVHELEPLTEYLVVLDAPYAGDTRQPLVYCKTEDSGRTVHLATGHTVAGLSTPAWQEIFRRCVRWAAGAPIAKA